MDKISKYFYYQDDFLIKLPPDHFKNFFSKPNEREFELVHFSGDTTHFSFRIKPGYRQSPEQAITECLLYIKYTHGDIVAFSVQDLATNLEIRISVVVNPPDETRNWIKALALWRNRIDLS